MLKLKIIKTIVFMLTFLLIFGIIILGMILVKKSKKLEPTVENIVLNEPVGSEIKGIVSGENELHILVKGGGQSDRIIIFDVKEGQKISTITLN